jgi:hypothetical protein
MSGGTPEIARRVEGFYHCVAVNLEAWVNRRKSDHKDRAYRGDVMAFTAFKGFAWPHNADELRRFSIIDVQGLNGQMAKDGGAPKTGNGESRARQLLAMVTEGTLIELRDWAVLES